MPDEEVIGKTSLDLEINPDAEGRARILAGLKKPGFVSKLELNLRKKSGEMRLFYCEYGYCGNRR